LNHSQTEAFCHTLIVDTVNAVGHVVSDPKDAEQDLIVGVVKDHKYTSITEETMPRQ
jgi:hypothetical protein